MKNGNIIGIALIVFVLSGSVLVIHYQAFASGCYDKFIFNWFSLNDVLICLDNSSGGGVTSLTSSNDAIILNATNGNVLISPHYELLCQNVTSSSVSSYSCSSFNVKQYLRIEIYTPSASASTSLTIRFNSDSGTNYAYVRSSNFGGVVSTASTTALPCSTGGTTQTYCIIDCINTASLAKLCILNSNQESGAGATAVPVSLEIFGKWHNTSNQITTITVSSGGANTFGSGSEITVWGYD